MKGMKEIIVKCDNDGCSWSRKVTEAEFKSWRNVPCPECGHKFIIDDKDMEVYKAVKVLLALNAIMSFIWPWGKRKEVELDSIDIKSRI